MAKSLKIEQYPKNKRIDQNKLSNLQIVVRAKEKKTYGKKKRCTKCGFEQLIDEFYIKDKKTGRRDNTCRDCRLKADGVVEIGKLRFAKRINDKGFQRCSVCKTIKPFSGFKKNKTRPNGYSQNCYDCSQELVRAYTKLQSENISVFYIKQYAYRRGIAGLSNEAIEELRTEIMESRRSKYFIDGKDFLTIIDFANFIESNYGIPITTTCKRIAEGKTEEQCKISKHLARSMAKTKGEIRVTDTINGDVFLFTNTRDPALLKMFSVSAVTKSIKTGIKTRVTSLSKYKNPCIIERM